MSKCLDKCRVSSDVIRASLRRREERELHTFGLYTIHQPRSEHWKYTPPFIAHSDSEALNALVELSRVNPELCRKNVYCIGRWCSVDCKLVRHPQPRLVVGKIEIKD